jgi:uncharacterized protein
VRRIGRHARPSTRKKTVATLARVTVIDLRTIRIRSGEQYRGTREVELDPVELGGQRYVPLPERPEAEITLSRTTSGLVLELEVEAALVGPCFRCLAETRVVAGIHGREYQATDPGADDELRTPYVADERLDLSAWARDAVVLALPGKILCREDCAGLCAVCGKDLNAEPHEHAEEEVDPRWAALAELRDRL